MLGKALVPKLQDCGFDVGSFRSYEYDLTDRYQTQGLFQQVGNRRQIEAVIHLAANVGGIEYNRQHPAATIYDNLMMGLNVIEQCRRYRVERVIVAGSVCAYPLHTPMPMVEENLWVGPPEPTNGPYGVAKRTLSSVLTAYRMEYGLQGGYLLLANMYGPNDNFGEKSSHVIPSLIRKFDEAKRWNHESVTIWGTGRPSRDFLYVEDAADAFIAALRAPTDALRDPINIGSGVETPIYSLVEQIKRVVGFTGETEWDKSKPDGQPRRWIDTHRAQSLLGWAPKTSLQDGLGKTYQWWEQQR